MNRIYLLTLSLLLSLGLNLPLSAADELPDTVTVIENVTNLIILREGSSTRLSADYLEMIPFDEDDEENNEEVFYQPFHFQYEVNVTDTLPTAEPEEFPSDWGMDIPFLGNHGDSNSPGGTYRVTRNITGLRHLFWGWRFNYDGKSKVKNSFEVGVRDLIGVSWRYRGAEFEIGFGGSLKRFLAADGFCYAKEGDRMTITPAPENVNVKSSRLDVWAFHIPLFYNQRIYRELSFMAGGVLNFNTYARANNRLEFPEKDLKVKYTGLQQNLLTVDLMGAIYISGIGVYASWSPMDLFRKSFGPISKGFSIGTDISF